MPTRMAWLEKTDKAAQRHDFVALLDDALFDLRNADSPLVVLRALADLRDLADQLEPIAVRHARAREATWSEVGHAMRQSRQQVHRKYGDTNGAS